MEKIITVFGSGNTLKNDLLFKQTEEIGKLLAENDFTVCCGGYGGTMEAVCKGAKSVNGKTIGITIDYPGSKPNEYVDENVIMPNWVERLMELIAIGDAYIILKGGSGTLVEVSAILEMMNKKIIKEKLMVFYTDFWKNVIDVLKQDSENLSKVINSDVVFENNIPGILTGIKNRLT